METLYFNAVKQSEAGTKLGGSVIRSGGLVAFPTETVYGLGANGLDGEAVNKIFEAKGRPNDNPLILHIAKKSDLKDLWKSVPERARLLMDEFWPGPLTMVYLKSSRVPEEVTGGLDTVAVRMPDNRTALALIRAAGVPIAAPSANLSGKPSPTTADHVKADMNGKIDVIIDGGPCNIGVESTVVSLMGGAVTILRPGGITREMLEAVIGPVNLSPAVLAPLKQGEAAASPGMKYKHYAPKADVTLLDGTFEQFKAYVEAHMDQNPSCLCFTGEAEKLGVPCVEYGREGDGADQAKHIFRSLRALDEQGDGIVYARCPKKDGLSMAVYNRLIRAAAFRVIVL